jgi:hypothetical protein
MKIGEVISRLEQEHSEEEIVFILQEDKKERYYVVDDQPFLHAGPANFIDKDGKEFSKSVVIVQIKKNK